MMKVIVSGTKRGIAALLIGAMFFSLLGCGQGSSKDDSQVKKEFYYVPEYKDLQLDIDYISNVIPKGDELFLLGSSWDERTEESSNKLYRYEMLSDTCEEMILPLDQNASVQRAAMDSEGNILMIMNRYEEAAEGEFESNIELWKVSAQDGSMISKTDMKTVFDDPDYAYVQYMTVDNRDNIYLSDGNFNIYILDNDGNKLGTVSTGENWIDSLFATKEGNVYLKIWGNEGPELKQIDPDSKSIGTAIQSETLKEIGYNQNYYPGAEKGILISNDNSVFFYDFEQDTKENLFDWLDADINSDDVEMLGSMTDGRFFVVLREYTGEKTEYSLAILKKTPASQMPEKEELMFGTMWLSQSMRKNIIDFNKSSDSYHISVKEYASTGDYDAGLTQFNNDITGGKGPDIVDVSGIDYKQYAAKGVFEDLYLYMEKSGIQKEDYLENVFRACEVDGRLYGIIPQFYVSTTIAKASKVGDVSGWTLSEMLDFSENSNADNIFPYGSRSGIFYYCIYNNIDEFINWETGECFFNGDDFIRVLEFADQFPEEPIYDDEEGIYKKLCDDRILLMQTSLGSVQEYQMYNGLFGEETAYIGFPNSERKGNLIQPTDGCVAINSKSKNKDGAWEFIKVFLSEDYQNSLVNEHGSWGFPVKKSALDKQFENDMTAEYYEDENGNKVEQMKTSWGYDDFNMDIYAAKQGEIDAVKKIISSAEKCAGSVNNELNNIITEETEAFFKGQKSAKETAEIIQNRIHIYVKENS